MLKDVWPINITRVWIRGCRLGRVFGIPCSSRIRLCMSVTHGNKLMKGEVRRSVHCSTATGPLAYIVTELRAAVPILTTIGGPRQITNLKYLVQSMAAMATQIQLLDFFARQRSLLGKERDAEIDRSSLLLSNCGPKLLEQKGLALGGLSVASVNIGLGGKT